MSDLRTAGDALRVATDWITSSKLEFSSAFIGGSIAHADPASPYDPASDVDCYLVIDGNPPAGKIGKVDVDGVLLDVSWMPRSQLEQAGSDAVIASLLYFGHIVRNEGWLGDMHQQVSAGFLHPEAINARVESMKAKIRGGLTVDSSQLPVPEQVMNWLFPATLATHIPLIRACAPLTVRKRFLAARQVMDPADYARLLSLYGFDDVAAHQAQAWLDETARLFDATTELAAKSDRFWATDIQASARYIAIDASQQLINAGDHREALYWIIATSARAITVRTDAGTESQDFLLAFTSILNELVISTAEQRQARSEAILTWINV